MKYKYPIRIGITGHRSLSEAEQKHVVSEINRSLEWVKEQVDRVRTQQGIGAGYYISGITPLAEGVDRLFADAVLGQGGRLEVILPFKKEIYEEDFGGQASIDQFNKLLSYDKYPIILDGRDNPNKEWAYYHTGKMVVDQCDVLIGAWNGDDAKGFGGTKNIIEYAKKSKVPVITIYLDENKKTEHFHTSKIDLSEYKKFDKEWFKSSGGVLSKQVYSTGFDKLGNAVGKEKSAHLERPINVYSLWDIAAMRNQHTHKRFVSSLYLFAAIASLIGIFTIVSEALKKTSCKVEEPSSFYEIGFHVTEAVILAMVIAWYIYIRNASKHRKWILSRVWAEKIRLLIFETLCTQKNHEIIDENISMALYQNKSWHSRIFLAIAKEINPGIGNSIPFNNRLEILRQFLVDAQINYHEGKSKVNERFIKRTKRISFFLLGMAFFCVVSEILLDVFKDRMNIGHFEYFHLAFGAAIILVPSVGAVLEGYKGVVDHEKALTINKNMIRRFNDVLNDLNHFCDSEEDLQQVFEKIKLLMLFENNEWIYLIKDPEPAV